MYPLIYQSQFGDAQVENKALPKEYAKKELIKGRISQKNNNIVQQRMVHSIVKSIKE